MGIVAEIQAFYDPCRYLSRKIGGQLDPNATAIPGALAVPSQERHAESRITERESGWSAFGT